MVLERDESGGYSGPEAERLSLPRRSVLLSPTFSRARFISAGDESPTGQGSTRELNSRR